MKKKQRILLDAFLAEIGEEYRRMFLDLAEYAVSLGYSPVRNKTKDLSIDFKISKTKRTIMKMEVKEQKHDSFRCGERPVPGLRLRFFAAGTYSEIFHEAVRKALESFGGKYTGCYGCGRCGGDPQGYIYRYSDGRELFRCGAELISIFYFDEGHVEEIKRLLRLQAEYDFEKAQKLLKGG